MRPGNKSRLRYGISKVWKKRKGEGKKYSLFLLLFIPNRLFVGWRRRVSGGDIFPSLFSLVLVGAGRRGKGIGINIVGRVSHSSGSEGTEGISLSHRFLAPLSLFGCCGRGYLLHNGSERGGMKGRGRPPQPASKESKGKKYGFFLSFLFSAALYSNTVQRSCRTEK